MTLTFEVEMKYAPLFHLNKNIIVEMLYDDQDEGIKM